MAGVHERDHAGEAERAEREPERVGERRERDGRAGGELEVVDEAAGRVEQQAERRSAPTRRARARTRSARSRQTQPAAEEDGGEEPRRDDAVDPLHDPRLIDNPDRGLEAAWDAGCRDPARDRLEPRRARGGRRGVGAGDMVRRLARLGVGLRGPRGRRREPRRGRRGQAAAGAAARGAGERRGARPRDARARLGRRVVERGQRVPGGLQRARLARGAGRRARGVVFTHALARAKRLRRRDLADRRQFLVAAAVGAGALVAWQVQRPLQRALGVPGAERRFTGSYDAGSFTGNDFPITSWVADDPRPRAGRCAVAGRVRRELELVARGARPWRRADRDARLHRRLLQHASAGRASGSAALLDEAGVEPGAAHVRVISRTGYRWSFGLEHARGLLLATRVGGEPLSHGHGAPCRLVAPGPPRLPVGQVGRADRGPRRPRPGRARPRPC